MSADINWIAIILAAISTMIVGSIWYGPLFGKLWAKLTGVKPDPDFRGGKAALQYIKAFLASLLTSIVLAYVIAIVHKNSTDSYFVDAIFVGLLLWGGFTAARIFMHDIFEGRPTQLTALNIAHELITIVVMSGIIGLLPV
ncbi:DUF1761 domain-containing protein [Patescibacteria group bacterium]|nr:MAG: DUF1761 domain-containing protein [Patescibacteria group bacterium]